MRHVDERQQEGLRHRHFLLFRSLNGARYLFDAETSTCHPWPSALSPSATETLYSTPDEDLPALLDSPAIPPEFAGYVLTWRRLAGAFRDPDQTPSLGQCGGQPHGSQPADSPRRNGEWKPSPSVLSNLILVLTDDCNLRCKYCIFSGQYDDHGFKRLRRARMTWDTARKAVDHFLALNDSQPFRALPRRKLDIAFFGGEPLLQEALLRRVVSYAQSKKMSHYQIYFSATTNLTHLPPGLGEFLTSNEVGLLVSIDGPEEIHDRYRRSIADRGTFRRVRANLEKLRRLNEEYFKKHVRAVVTLNGNSDLIAIRDFFDSGDPLVPPIDYVGNIRYQDGGKFHEQHPFDAERLLAQYRELLSDYLDRKRRRVPVPRGSFLYEFFEAGLKSIYERVMFVGAHRRRWITGTCQPGRRLAVSTDGRFHTCERINEHFPLGDVEHGLDLDRVATVQRQYLEALPDCRRCWVRSLCGACYANACHADGEFRFSGEGCDRIRKGVAHQLVNLYTLLEDVPDALSCGDPLIDRHRLLELPS